MHKFLICLLCSLFCSALTAQNADSLLIEARQQKDDSLQFSLYRQSAFALIFSDKQKAKEVLEEGLALSLKKDNPLGQVKLLNVKGIYMDVHQQSDSAHYYFRKALEKSRAFGFKSQEASGLNNLGMYNWNVGKFEEALGYFFEALKLNEAHGDPKNNAKYLNNIGLIYQEMLLLEKSLEFHRKSLALRKEFNLLNEQPASFNNIGICLTDLKRYEEAEATYMEGLQVAKKANNLLEYYLLLENLGYMYMEQEKNALAEEYFSMALDRPETLGRDPKSELIISGHLIGLYNRLNRLEESQRYIQKASEILKEYPDLKTYADHIHANSVESHYRSQKLLQARAAFKAYAQLKDSVFSKNSATALADMEVRYDTEKKERKLLEQKVAMTEKDLTIQRKEYQLIGLIILLLLIGLIGYLIYNQQQIKHLQFKKETALREAMAQIETQNKMQEQRLAISRDLHDNIGSQLTFIISSIDNLGYGFELEKPLTDKLNQISGFTRHTIGELRDTIWAMNRSTMTFEELQGRISNFLSQAQQAEERIMFSFEAEEALQQKELTSLQAMNIYRIVQESVNNSIKHANPSEVKVEASFKEGIYCTIRDNGKGFNLKSISDGNGLHNLRKRASDIGAEVHIESSQKGTYIQLSNIQVQQA